MQTVYILSQTVCIISEFELDEEITDLSDEPGDYTRMLKSCECVMGRVGQSISDRRISEIRPQPMIHLAPCVKVKTGEVPISLPSH